MPGSFPLARGGRAAACAVLLLGWHNADVMIHTATGAPAFDTGFVSAGTDSAPITMGVAGTFPYRCLLHSGMSGTLRVTP